MNPTYSNANKQALKFFLTNIQEAKETMEIEHRPQPNNTTLNPYKGSSRENPTT